MHKYILYIIVSLGIGAAISAVANSAEPVENNAAMKIVTITQMYQQDVNNQGMDNPVVLQQYGTQELQAAMQLEQDYFDREQMSCHIGYDVLWDSQDPDYEQDKKFSVTPKGLVKASLAQGSDIYYELACDSIDKELKCQVADVILDEDIYNSQTLKSYLIKNCA